MKKSILFSSIAATTCLLIQASASAAWTNFSGELALTAGTMSGLSSISTSNVLNNWTTSVQLPYDRNGSSASYATSWAENSFNATKI